jgi:hypothetical protein
MYWNHNSAYYPWIQKKVASCRTVLDVGCGDGSLVLFLDDGTKRIVGIEKNKLHEIRLAGGDSTTSATQTDASMMPSSPMSTRNSPKLWLEEEAAWL